MTVNSMAPLFNETQWARRISTERSTNETHVVYYRINEKGQSLFRVTECTFHSLEGATWATDNGRMRQQNDEREDDVTSIFDYLKRQVVR